MLGYHAAHDLVPRYCYPNPVWWPVSGTKKLWQNRTATWDGFNQIGFSAGGAVYFQYACGAGPMWMPPGTPPGSIRVQAVTDLDGDNVMQAWEWNEQFIDYGTSGFAYYNTGFSPGRWGKILRVGGAW
jgi:hypothetical protein